MEVQHADNFDVFDFISEKFGGLSYVLLFILGVGLVLYPRQSLTAIGMLIVCFSAIFMLSLLLYILLRLIAGISGALGGSRSKLEFVTTLRVVVAAPIALFLLLFMVFLYFPLESLVFVIFFPIAAITSKRQVAGRLLNDYPTSLRSIPDLLERLREWIKYY